MAVNWVIGLALTAVVTRVVASQDLVSPVGKVRLEDPGPLSVVPV